MDVKVDVENVVESQGRSGFRIDRSMNLMRLFRVNPIRGYRKLLKVWRRPPFLFRESTDAHRAHILPAKTN